MTIVPVKWYGQYSMEHSTFGIIVHSIKVLLHCGHKNIVLDSDHPLVSIKSLATALGKKRVPNILPMLPSLACHIRPVSPSNQCR